MIIKKIKIKNFKTLKDFEIEPKPLTLLFGANSSGKSNFIRAMLFFKKNVLPLRENMKDFRNGQLSYKLNENVDLISYEQIVSDGDTSLKISYEFILKFSYYNINSKVDANMAVCFEFNNGTKREFLNKISFSDLNKDINLDFIINENNSVEVKCNDTNFDLSKLILPVSDHYNYSELPFYEIGFDRFMEKYESKKYENEQMNNYYIYFSLIPALFESYFSTKHFPQLREVPQKTYILDNGYFGKKVYYDLLDSLYRHQESFMNSLLNSKKKKPSSVSSKTKFYSSILEKIINIRKKYPDDNIRELFYCFMSLTDLTNEVKLKDIIKYNRDLKEKNGEHYPDISKFEKVCNKSEQALIKYLYDTNGEYESLLDYDYSFGCYWNPQFIRNLSVNVNTMLFSLGFDGILYVNKEKDIVGLEFVMKNNKSFNVTNESSGFLQILPILLGMSMLKESYDFSFDKEQNGILGDKDETINIHLKKDKKHVFAFQNYKEDSGSIYLDGFNISRMLTKSLYIEQPELHLHPKLQSKFINVVLAELNNFNLHNSIIMETHSEHILKKIQIEIAKGIISQNDVGVYFIGKKNGLSKADKIGFNEFGQLEKDFPDGFFDDTLNLSYEFYKAIKNKS